MIEIFEFLFALLITFFILFCLWKSCEQEIELEPDDDDFECCC